jgi:hypothetical protein
MNTTKAPKVKEQHYLDLSERDLPGKDQRNFLTGH